MRLLSLVIFSMFLNQNLHAANSLSYSGRLVQASGAPVSGPVNLRAELVYTNATTVVLCSQNLSSVALTKGVFHLKLDLDCTPKTMTQVLSETPIGESVAIRIIDQLNSKTYPLQAIHSVPYSKVAEQLPKMGASTGQALVWDGTKWAPTSVGTGNGTVTNIVTGTGLTGGPISTTGTISVAAGGITSTELAANSVTASKINAGEISNSHISASAAIDYSKLNIPNTTIPYAKLQINDGDIPASKVSGLSGVIDDILASVISNGDLTHAPTGDAVFDALALKADTTNFAQTITALAVTGLGIPSSNSDATNKQYVDNAITTLTTTANSKVSKSGDSMSGSLTVTGTVSATNFSGDGSGLTGVSVDPNSNIQLSGETAKTIGVLRRTAPDSAGTVLTVNSSGATTGATNKNGGNLVLSSGAATGYGSSAIEFKTAGGGTTGTADSLPTTKVMIDGDGHVGIGLTSSSFYHDLTIKRTTPGATAIQLVDSSSGVGSSDGVTMSLNGSVFGFKHQETGGAIRFSTLEDSYAMEVKGDRVGINRNAPGSHLDISLGGATATDALRINSIDAAAGDLLIVKPNGNVGIGVLAPTQKLDVAGNINATQLCIAGDCKSSWPSMTVSAGSVTSTEIADGTIQTADLGNAQVTYAKLNLADGDIPLAKLNGASDATKYLRGDKTWSTFATDAINSVLSSFTVGTGTKPAVTNTDTVASAFGKVQKTLDDINADYVSKTLDQTINGTLAINSATGFITVPTPINPNDAANKAYVDGFGQWVKSGANIYYDAGSVGIGTTTPTSPLTVNGTALIGNSSTGFTGTWNALVIGNTALGPHYIMDGGSTTNRVRTLWNSSKYSISKCITDSCGSTSSMFSFDSSSKVFEIPGSKISLAGSTPTHDLEFPSGGTRRIGFDRTNTSESDLEIHAGAPPVGSTDRHGGDLILKSGISTGTGDSGIQFFTVAPNSTGTTDNNPSLRMQINPEGYVGVGNTSPTGRVDIKGSGQGGPGNGAAFNILRLGNASALDFGEYAGGDTWIQASNRSNYVTKQNLILNPDGGSIGIGTSTPGAKLEVAGQIKITGGTPGAGKVLTSDASGLASWTAVTGDNLGNHNASQNINLGGYKLVGGGGTDGITVNASGDVYIDGFFRSLSSNSAKITGFRGVFVGGVEEYQITANSNNSSTYNPSNGTALHSMTGISTANSNAQDNTYSFYNLNVKNTAGTRQHSYMAAVSSNGTVAPNLVFGHLTGANQYNEYLRISPSGNVGVANTAPQKKLDIAGNFRTVAPYGGYASAALYTHGGGYGQLEIFNDSSSTDLSYLSFHSGGNIGWQQGIQGSNYVISQTSGLEKTNNDIERLTITSTGNVGIGTTSPNAKLQVVGGTTNLEQSAWNYPALTNGWSNYGGGYANFGYRIDSMGYLRLRGLIKNGATGSANSFVTLPVGFRPLFIQEFVVAAPSGTANIIINSSGVMYVETMSSNAWISLDNVSLPLD